MFAFGANGQQRADDLIGVPDILSKIVERDFTTVDRSNGNAHLKGGDLPAGIQLALQIMDRMQRMTRDIFDTIRKLAYRNEQMRAGPDLH